MTDTTAAPAAATETAPPPTAPADQAALQARDAELNALAQADLPRYRYSEGGKLANEHVAIRKAMQAAKEATAPQEVAEQSEAEAEGDDADADGTELVAAETEAAEDETGEETDEADDGDLAEYEDAIEPWQPPEGQQVAEYAKPALEALDKLVGDAEQRDAIIGLYDQVVTAQQAHHAELNKTAKTEMMAALRAEQGANIKTYIAEVNEAFAGLPKDLRAALSSARLPDGRLIANLASTMRAIHQLGTAALVARSGQQPRQAQEDRRVSIQRELDEMDAAMHADVANLYKPWRGTGQIMTDRKLALMRELDGTAPPRPSAAATRTELREIEDLKRRDPRAYALGSWRGGRSASERHMELLRGRA